MLPTHTPAGLQQQYPNVFNVLAQGETTPEQLLVDIKLAGLTTDDLPIMEAALRMKPEYLKGLPFPGEDAKYDKLVKHNSGFALLQKFMNFWF